MKQYTVYKLVFPNGKLYIGTTSQFKARMRSHKVASIHGGTRPIQKALKKYGWDTVRIEIIAENISDNEAYMIEIKTIKELNTKVNGYNCADGGKINRGYTMVAWNKGKKLSIEHVEALRSAKVGKSYTEISRNNATIFPVEATNQISGEILRFPSAIAFAKHASVKWSSVYTHIYRNSKLLNREWTVRRCTS